MDQRIQITVPSVMNNQAIRLAGVFAISMVASDSEELTLVEPNPRTNVARAFR